MNFGASSSNVNDPTLKNYLFGTVTLTKNADIDKYGYSFFISRWWIWSKCINFGVDMSFYTHIDNKKKDILVLGICPTQGLEHTVTAEKMYSINFTVSKNKFCLSLHYNRANSHLFCEWYRNLQTCKRF